MAEAVIVSTARTPIGKAYRGAFNNTHGADMAGHVIAHAVKRAGVEPAEVEDVIMGCALPEGATGQNIARQAALDPVQPLGQIDDAQLGFDVHLVVEIRSDPIPFRLAVLAHEHENREEDGFKAHDEREEPERIGIESELREVLRRVVGDGLFEGGHAVLVLTGLLPDVAHSPTWVGAGPHA